MPQTYFESQAHSRLIIHIGSFMPQTYHRLIHASDTRIMGSFPPHRYKRIRESWAHSRLIATHGYTNHWLIRASSLHTDTRIMGSFTPHRYTRTHRSLAHSRLIATYGYTNQGGGGDPNPASLDGDLMVDPIHLLLGGGITGVGAVAD